MDEFTSGVEMELQESAHVADVQALAEITEQEAQHEPAVDEQPKQEAAQKDGGTEPGWMKRRIDAGIQKGLAAARREWEAAMQAEFTAKMAPLYERLYEQEADKLVADGEFKTKERALEYVKLKNGTPTQQAATPQQETSRDEKGRFVSRDTDNGDAKATAERLLQQANELKAEHGFDAMALFRSNEAIKQKVVTGKLDFNDLYELYGQNSQPKPSIPAPMRSANGSVGSTASIVRTMSDKGFEKLDAELASGKKYRTT